MVATSAPEDVRMLMRANSLPPASNLHAFHVSSFMALSPGFFSPCRSRRVAPAGRGRPPRGCRVPLAGLAEYPGGRGAYPPGGFDLLAQKVPDLHHLHVLRLVQSEESVDCLALLEVVLGSGLWQCPWPWRGWREWEWWGGDVKGAPFKTFAYEVPFVLAFALATSNLRFSLSITLRWSRSRCCCCCCCC
jgi:hypothetical protein